MAGRQQVRIAAPDDLETLIPSWRRSLAAGNKAPMTLVTYLGAVTLLDDYLRAQGMPTSVAHIRREHVESFLEDLLTRQKPASVANRYRACKSFFAWLVEMGDIKSSPMEHVRAPAVPETPPPLVSEDDLRKLRKATAGQSFDDRRDRAIIDLFLDCGLRLSELANLTLDDVDLDRGEVTVLGKGRRPRTVAFGRRTTSSLDVYITRARARHRLASSTPALWLGLAGPMTSSGVIQIVHRRCEDAGIGRFNVHRFRHVWAHQALAGGQNESDVMATAGWKSPQMLRRYGASLAAERARASQRKHSFLDRL